MNRSERWLNGVGGGALLLLGLRVRPFPGTLLGVAGSALLFSALSGRRLFELTLPAHTAYIDEHIQFTQSVHQVFQHFRTLECMSDLIPQLQRVEDLNSVRSRWTAQRSDGSTHSWDVEVVELRQDRLLVWRGVGDGADENTGRLVFRSLPDGGTDLHVQLSFSAGKASVSDRLRHLSPEREVLGNFLQLSHQLGRS